jgi:hypothetical protein
MPVYLFERSRHFYARVWIPPDLRSDLSKNIIASSAESKTNQSRLMGCPLLIRTRSISFFPKFNETWGVAHGKGCSWDSASDPRCIGWCAGSGNLPDCSGF